MHTNKPHDPFLKALLADTAFASSFLEGFLPETLIDVLELQAIQHEKGSFVSKALEESFADALFRVPLKGQDASCFVSRDTRPCVSTVSLLLKFQTRS